MCVCECGSVVWLTSEQPERILAELECEIQRDLFVLYGNDLLWDVSIIVESKILIFFSCKSNSANNIFMIALIF